MKKQKNIYLLMGCILFAIITIIPLLSKSYLLNTIVLIRDAINSGDSGKLILATAKTNMFFTSYNILLYISLLLILTQLNFYRGYRNIIKRTSLLILFVIIKAVYQNYLVLPWEPLTDIIAITLISVLMTVSKEYMSYTSNLIISIQVFFAVQWINIIPVLSRLRIGGNDIFISIKIVAKYLNSEAILNAVSIAFLFPLLLSSIMTSLLYRSHHRNMIVVEENFEKARELENMKNKIMENKIYQEINALAHDLKTPLVTIRGLNSLLLLSKDLNKLASYNGRIESAVEKMNEMISSFLYSKSKQIVEIPVLMNYIRAQIPIEDETLRFDIICNEELPPILVNKVRISRAIINLIENAIMAQCNDKEKEIVINIDRQNDDIVISIKDNGVGIKVEQLDKIWEIGHSTKNTSGLGLPFAKQIIEENDGCISLSSKYGEGTELIVRLPIAIEDDRSDVEWLNQ